MRRLLTALLTLCLLLGARLALAQAPVLRAVENSTTPGCTFNNVTHQVGDVEVAVIAGYNATSVSFSPFLQLDGVSAARGSAVVYTAYNQITFVNVGTTNYHFTLGCTGVGQCAGLCTIMDYSNIDPNFPIDNHTAGSNIGNPAVNRPIFAEVPEEVILDFIVVLNDFWGCSASDPFCWPTRFLGRSYSAPPNGAPGDLWIGDRVQNFSGSTGTDFWTNLQSSDVWATGQVGIVGPTGTPAPTPPPTNTPQPTNTPTPTNTPRPTGTPTFTPGPTSTPTPTGTPTQTGTPTFTPSPSPTGPTQTATPTATATATFTATPTATATSTFTPRPTGTPTHTIVPTATSTPTVIPTAVPTPGSCRIVGPLYDQSGQPAANTELDFYPTFTTLISGSSYLALPGKPPFPGVRVQTDANGQFNLVTVCNVVGTFNIPASGAVYKVQLPPLVGTYSFNQLINQPQAIVQGFPPQLDLNMGGRKMLDVLTDNSLAQALSHNQSTTQSFVDVCATAPTAGSILTYTSGGVQWCPGFQVGTIDWSGNLGALTSSAVKVAIAPCSGHFLWLMCSATLTGTCATGPTINVGDVTQGTTGTSVPPNMVIGNTASPNVAQETLGFTSGDTIALEQTGTPGTCTVPVFTCNATYSCP